MTLFTDSVFLTNEQSGFKFCRETRTSNVATMTALLCKEGHIDVWYQGHMIRISKNELFVRIPDPQYELGPYEMSPDFEFLQLTIDASIFESVMFEHMRLEPRWWHKQEYLKAHPIFPLNAISREFCEAYFHLIRLQLGSSQSDYRKRILMAIARANTMELLNFLEKVLDTPEDKSARKKVNASDYTFHKFTQLLQQHPHQREVQWFAEVIGITPKYLSEICKEVSDKSASEWIADVTVTELKHYLRNTTLPIHEIARVMQFPNPSFFCQYTKKHTGLSPNQFRKRRD